jgi:hypothetical protein
VAVVRAKASGRLVKFGITLSMPVSAKTRRTVGLGMTRRRVVYTVNRDSLFRHSAQEGQRVGPFLDILAATGTEVTPGPEDPADAGPGHT